MLTFRLHIHVFHTVMEATCRYLRPSAASISKRGKFALALRLALEGLWDHFSHSAVTYWLTWPTQPRAGREPATAHATSVSVSCASGYYCLSHILYLRLSGYASVVHSMEQRALAAQAALMSPGTIPTYSWNPPAQPDNTEILWELSAAKIDGYWYFIQENFRQLPDMSEISIFFLVRALSLDDQRSLLTLGTPPYTCAISASLQTELGKKARLSDHQPGQSSGRRTKPASLKSPACTS
eukprot:IDg5189t1